MRIDLHKSFLKDYVKLPGKIQEKFKERRNLFLEDQFHPLLNSHFLKGEYKGCRSINITGNIRAIFIPKDEDIVVFIRVDTHSELYE